MSTPELFVVLTSDGTAWASAEPVEGEFPHTVVHPIRRGEAVEEVPYEAWHAVLGQTVDLEEFREELRRGRLPAPVEEAEASTPVGSDTASTRKRLGWTIIVGLAIVAVAGPSLVAQAWARATYSAVNALVIDTAVRGEAAQGRTWYAPIVRYQYEVGGKQYEGSGFRWDPGLYADSLKAARKLDPYGPGQRVTVYVHPDDVTRSFLRRDGASKLIPASVFILGLLVLMYRYRVTRDVGT